MTTPTTTPILLPSSDWARAMLSALFILVTSLGLVSMHTLNSDHRVHSGAADTSSIVAMSTHSTDHGHEPSVADPSADVVGAPQHTGSLTAACVLALLISLLLAVRPIARGGRAPVAHIACSSTHLARCAQVRARSLHELSILRR